MIGVTMLADITGLARISAQRVRESISSDYLQQLDVTDIHSWDAPGEKFWCLTWRATWNDRPPSTFQIVYPEHFIHTQGLHYVLDRTVSRLLREVFELQQEAIEQEPYPWQKLP
jgi:hypothetical protein